MTRPKLHLIAALDAAGGIGKDGGIPWRCPEDMKLFRELTIGSGRNGVVMGRKTWESLPAPLRHRVCFVLTRSDLKLPLSACRIRSIDEALAWQGYPLDEVWVIGGAEVYAQALSHPELSDVHISRIAHIYGCDTYFPDVPLPARTQFHNFIPEETP